MSLARAAATRVYALALRAFPAGHRATYAAEMVEAFETEVAARRREHGRWHALRFVVAACLNVVSEGLGERRRRRRSHQTPIRFVALATLGHDLVHAARSLANARAFALVCALSLGLGMATVLAILVFMRAVFEPPPGVEADGLVELLVTRHGSLAGQAGGPVIDTWSYPDFADVRDADTGLATTGWTVGESILRLPDQGGAVRVPTMYVSPNYFTTVGVALWRGTGFDASTEDGSTAGPAVVIGHRLWQTRLNADPEIVGRTLTVNRVGHLVVGIAPDGFRGHVSPEEAPNVQLWMPLGLHPRLSPQAADTLRFNRDLDWLRVLGRLSPGTSLARADAAIASIVAGLAERYPSTNALKTASVEPYAAMGARLEPEIGVVRAGVLGVSGMVLLVVCLNVSGMMLVRGATRERELAVRLAIGASRGRLMRYLLAEAVVLSLLGGAFGAALLIGGPSALAWWFDARSPALDLLTRPDARMLATCLGLSFATSLVFGLLPAIRFSRPSLVAALKDDVGGGGRRVGRVQRLTAAFQAGLAVPFLVIGVVKLDQVRATATADLGFEPRGLVAAPLDLAATGHADDAASYLRSIREGLADASGVVSVTVADGLPLDFRRRITRVSREGEAAVVGAHTTRVAGGYFQTMGVRLVRGRGITDDDRAGAEPVVVVSEPLATRLFPNGNALGDRLTFALEGNTTAAFTVIGVTADAVTSQMGTPRPQMFVPLAQHPTQQVVVIARGSAVDASLASAFQNAVTGLEPDFIRSSLVTGDGLVRRSMFDLGTHSTLAGVCAAIALALAGLGVYGVVGFMVATETREIGVRIALGASRPRVVATVLADAFRLVVPGVAVGLVLAVAWVRTSDPSWYPLGGVEPMAYAVAAGIALAVAMLAGLPSARRAATVEPIVAMRSE